MHTITSTPYHAPPATHPPTHPPNPSPPHPIQTEGLHSTSATRAAFEIQTTNVIVPLLSSLSGEAIGGQTWGAALGALVGVGVLGSGTGGATAVAE